MRDLQSTHTGVAPTELPEPHSNDAEQAVLGALLLDNGSLQKIRYLHALHFCDPCHRILFEHIIKLIDGSVVVDLVTLSESLNSAGKLAEVGGMEYLGQLIENVPSSANICHYAQIVREHALRQNIAKTPKQAERSIRLSDLIGRLPEVGYVRQSQLIPAIVPFSSATLWRKVKASTFPAPVKLSPRTTAWDVIPVRRWLANPDGFRSPKGAEPASRE